MSCTSDQKWSIQPWDLTQCHQRFFGGHDSKRTKSEGEAVRTWAEKVEMAFSVLIQIGASPSIMLYDPSHSAARQKPQVRLTPNPDHYAASDMISHYTSSNETFKYQTSS